jgi:putative AdoMet-dependent methyltransferase
MADSARPGWWFDEFRHLGVDFDDVAQVEAYSQKQGTRPEDEQALIARLGIASDDTVLEFGCGTGIFALEAARVCAHVTAVDISKTMLAYVGQRAAQAGLGNVTLTHGGFLSYEHASAPVSLIVSKYAFHHLPDFWKAIALTRMAAMLKPGGRLYLEDVVFSFVPQAAAVEIDAWIGRIVTPDAASFSTADFEMHVREEHSTFGWILEGLLERSGFDVVEKHVTDPAYTSFLAVRR